MLRSHRSRLTLVSAGSAGLIFLLIFTLSGIGLRKTELSSAENELAPAFNQVVEDVRKGEGSPDLSEIVQANPEVSVSIFGPDQKLIVREGRLNLPYTAASGVQPTQLGQLILRSQRVGDRTVVAGLVPAQNESLLERFVLLVSILWFPLVGVVALLTWITAKATFQPLERLAREAEYLSAESLTERLHVEEGEYREFVLRLNRFLDRIEGSVRREERFLSDAAHELRTPLTVLRGEIETVLRKNRPGEEYRATLHVLHDETSRLSSLVELLLRTVAPAQHDNSVLDFGVAAQKAHARWLDRFVDKGIDLQVAVSSGKGGLSDAEFDVLVDNLLSNSLRASMPGSKCRVDVGEKDGLVHLTVSDEGPGVAADERERIFERFARADSGRSRSDGGFGIGLALCRRIVESRGGTIRVEPNEPSGSRFVIELPAC